MRNFLHLLSVAGLPDRIGDGCPSSSRWIRVRVAVAFVSRDAKRTRLVAETSLGVTNCHANKVQGGEAAHENNRGKLWERNDPKKWMGTQNGLLRCLRQVQRRCDEEQLLKPISNQRS